MKPFFRFTSLKFRIAFIYASLLGVTLASVVLVVDRGIDLYGEQASLAEMAVNARVFDQLLSLRIRRLEDSARILSHDFGFRSAVATHDQPTINSVLDSLSSRADAEYAFTIDLNGRSGGARGYRFPAIDRLMPAIRRGDRHGVVEIDGQLAMAVVVPIDAPNLIGWLILAHRLDGREMAALAGLAPSRLIAEVVPSRAMPPLMRRRPARTAVLLYGGDGAILAWRTTLPALEQGLEAELILRRPLQPQLANYATLKHLLIVIALTAMVIVTLASWRLAFTITRPLRRLEEAAREFGRGRSGRVAVESVDEVGRLAETYNVMVAAIEDREQRILDAMHDPLTLLPNRRLFLQRLHEALDRLGLGDVIVLILADIDDFKNVNDTLGHPGGDALLREIGARLTALFGESRIARLGGDEFAILVHADAASLDTTALGEKVVFCLNQEMSIAGDVVIPSGSVGMAMTSAHDDRDTVLLMKRADLALYAAKGAGKNCAHLFDTVLDESSRRQRALELDLRRALRDGEFRFAFQPIYDLRSGGLTGFEALMRWRRQTGEEIGPVLFIPAAERSGQINALGDWAIAEACRRAGEWSDGLTVSVNVSPRQLMNPALFGVVVESLMSSGLAPCRLIIEITESVFIENMSVALQTLRKLQTIGVRIALDDFGTGYSSLNFLRSFPFDRVKIDKCFVNNLAPGSSANAVIRAILTLADALGIETVAEGVETAAQLDILRQEGCAQVQGYYLGRPIEREGIPQLPATMPASGAHGIVDLNEARKRTVSRSRTRDGNG